MNRVFLLLAVVAVSGCKPEKTLTVDEQVRDMRKCIDAGLAVDRRDQVIGVVVIAVNCRAY